MPVSQERIAPDYTFLFKALDGVENGGCRVAVWLPTSDVALRSLPLAMMSHGGGWMVGALDSVPYNQIRHFHSQGVAVASFEYRKLPHAHLKEVREDLMDAYRYVQSGLNRDLGTAGCQDTIDGARCSFMGWSAGGSNSLWIAGDVSAHNREHPGELPPLRAIITSYPLTRLESCSRPLATIDECRTTRPEFDQALKDILAGPCSTTFKVNLARFQDPGFIRSSRAVMAMVGHTDVLECLGSWLVGKDVPWPERTTPCDVITPDFPPTCVLAAEADALIPVQQSYDVYSRLQELGVDSLLAVGKDMQHGEAECMGYGTWNETWWHETILPSLDFAIQRMKA